MRYVIPILLAASALAGCKEEGDKAKKDAPPAPAPVVSAPPVIPTTRGPTNDHKDIQGKWQTSGSDAPVQFEFSGDMLIIRSGPGPEWKETGRYKYTLKDQVIPPQIDWGEGANAASGLYTIDGKNLIVTYAKGGPENRPKKIELKKPPVVQLYMTKVK